MIILNLEKVDKPGVVVIKAILENEELEQLLGTLDGLCVFATKTITEPASAIQTGARHAYAKYLLFPVRLRRQFKADDFDFEKIACGAITRGSGKKLYVIYEVPKKGF